MAKSSRQRMPRISSPAGVSLRFAQRVATMSSTNDKYRGGFKRPGSRNPRKVGRG